MLVYVMLVKAKRDNLGLGGVASRETQVAAEARSCLGTSVSVCGWRAGG